MRCAAPGMPLWLVWLICSAPILGICYLGFRTRIPCPNSHIKRKVNRFPYSEMPTDILTAIKLDLERRKNYTAHGPFSRCLSEQATKLVSSSVVKHIVIIDILRSCPPCLSSFSNDTSDSGDWSTRAYAQLLYLGRALKTPLSMVLEKSEFLLENWQGKMA